MPLGKEPIHLLKKRPFLASTIPRLLPFIFVKFVLLSHFFHFIYNFL